MTKKAAPEKTSRNQLIGLVLILIGLISLSTFGTLVALGVIFSKETPPPVTSMLGAEQVCDQRVRKDQGGVLSNVSVDDRSSRYDTKSGQYKMYYQIEVYRDKTKLTGINTFYINCFVAAKKGTVARMEYLELEEAKSKAVRRTKGNAFGM